MIKPQGCNRVGCESMFKTVFCLICLLLSGFASAVDLSHLNPKNFNAREHLYYLPLTKPTRLNADTIGEFARQSFTAYKQVPYSSRLGDAVLYRMSFNNDTNATKQLILQIDNPMLDDLQLFVLKQNQLQSHEALGDLQNNQPDLKNSLPHFTLNFAPNEQLDIYVKTASIGSTVTPILLHDAQGFQVQVSHTFLTWGAFVGTLILIMAYNLLLYRGIRDRIHLIYISYIAVMLVQLGVVYGYGFEIFPFALQSQFNIHLVSINYLLSILAILFSLYFLRYHRQPSGLFRLSAYFCAALGLMGIATLFIPENIAAKIYYPIQPLIYILIARICIPRLFDGNRWSSYYLLSWIPLFIGTTVAQLLLLDIISYSYATQHALMFGVILQIAFISMALTERFRAKENERIYNVTHDSVTGLPNHILLTECTERQMYAGQPFTLIMFQAERFSQIKPALGLVAANNLVSAIVDNVSDYFSSMDNLYVFEQHEGAEIRLSRINDDTFGLLLMGEHEQDELSYIILTIQEAVSTPINVGGYNVSTSCTVGSVSYPEYGFNAEMVIQKALHSLDMAKKEDAKYAFYSNDNVDIQDQLQLVADLQKAIDNDSLEMYHQPQIRLSDQTLYGNEALLRWVHPERGFISPEVFVALAEDTGIISELTEWVITKSLEQHAQLLAAGFRQNTSINLSAKDLTQPGLIAHIMTTIADLSLDPATIIFELTESATSDDPVHARNTINQLHDLGLKVAIDDFGTGYSSLEYLSKLPFHELKVDKSFILDILSSQRDQAITKTTIEMAKNLGIFVVAEGVETDEIERLLLSYGCEIGQGYYYAKPLPLAQYMAWLRSDNRYVQHFKPPQVSGEVKSPSAQHATG